VLSKSNDLLLKIAGISARTDAIVTEEEIRSMLSESAQSGQIQEIEQDIVERVFALGDRKVNTLMTHRSDIVWLDINDSPSEIRRKIGNDLHGAFPVSDGELDELLGLVLLKDLFHDLDRPGFVLKEALVQPILAPPSSSAYKLLEHFREKRFHYAIVVDEFGSVQGLITMDDILDALVGDVSEAGQEEYAMAAEGENNWIADGQYPFFEFLRMLDLDEEEFVHEDYSTLAGFLITQMDRIPQVGDTLVWRGFRFEVLSMAGRKIERLRILKERS
jgi:putative hemolysin